MTTAFGRLFRTATHLRVSQLGWRLVHEARLRVNAARPPQRAWADGAARFAVSAPGDVREAKAGRGSHVAELWHAGKVEYLALQGDRGDWAGVGRPKLWRYERQYHAELPALALLAKQEPTGPWIADANELVASWVQACPQPRGDAWEPYPVARRVLNWSLAGALCPALASSLAPGLAAQVRFLSRHLEQHLLGNHLLCDAAALVAGAAAVEAKGVDGPGNLGGLLLAHELARQVLPDGGYAERTAQYHAIVLRDVLLALALRRARGRELDPRIAEKARAMAVWLAAIARGDGVPCLNDAAPDAAPSVVEVLSLARALELIEGPWDSWLGRAFGLGGAPDPAASRGDLELPDTGWSIARQDGHELLFEHGPIGPPEQPGHGHSDALSYELLWGGHPVVTDTGVTTYEIGSVRDFERSAAAHATVTVGGEGGDELWAAFRVGGRADVRGGALGRTPEGARIFEGRMRAAQGWLHRRSIVFWPGEGLFLFDTVEGARDAVRSHLPLAPGCMLEGDGALRFAGGTLRLQVLRGTRDAGKPSWMGRGFGRREPRLSVTLQADATGHVAYALLAEGRTAALEGRSCSIRGPRGAVKVSLPT